MNTDKHSYLLYLITGRDDMLYAERDMPTSSARLHSTADIISYWRTTKQTAENTEVWNVQYSPGNKIIDSPSDMAFATEKKISDSTINQGEVNTLLLW